MQVIIKTNYNELVDEAVRHITSLIKAKPDAVLCLPTGNTPTGVYEKLIELYNKKEIDFSRIRTFNLDEYVDIPATHPSSFRYYMFKTFFDHVNIKQENIHFPPSELGGPGIPNITGRCLEYEELIRQAGGLDMAILGIGRNGHIGFNEPTSSLQSRTRVKTLTGDTLRDNDIEFEGERLPDLAVTMGIGTIMDARSVLLLASGESKAAAVKNTIEGPISAFWPATILQLHAGVKTIIDEKSADFLSRKSYYKKVYERTLQVEKVLNIK